MNAIKDTLTFLVGPPAAPIKSFKNREMRGRINSLLHDSEERPDLQLRGYLSIGKVPPSNLLSAEVIASALSAQDHARYLSRLSTIARFLDAQAALAATKEFVRKTEVGETYRLAMGLTRSARNWTKANTPSPTDATIVSFLELVSLLIGKIDLRQLTRKTKKGRGVEDFLPLMKLGVNWAVLSKDGYTSLLAIEILISAHKRFRLDIDSLTEQDVAFTRSLGVAHVRALQRLKAMAEAGDILSFEKWAMVILESRFKTSEMRKSIQMMFQERARFSGPIQIALTNLLGISDLDSTAPAVSVEAPQSIQTGQLSSALLHAWSAKDEGPRAKEVFEELESVLTGFLGIKLGGEVGTIEPYNPRLHEFIHGETPGPVVQVVRPWVEISQEDKVSIAIKALVRAKPQGG